MIPNGVTWPDVAGAFILALPGITAAVLSYLNRQNLKTSNGKSIAQMVEDVHGKESTSKTPYPVVAPAPAPPAA